MAQSYHLDFTDENPNAIAESNLSNKMINYRNKFTIVIFYDFIDT
jgi:hypothetical protein